MQVADRAVRYDGAAALPGMLRAAPGTLDRPGVLPRRLARTLRPQCVRPILARQVLALRAALARLLETEEAATEVTGPQTGQLLVAEQWDQVEPDQDLVALIRRRAHPVARVLGQPERQVLAYRLRCRRDPFAGHRVGLQPGQLVVHVIPTRAVHAAPNLAAIGRDDVRPA